MNYREKLVMQTVICLMIFAGVRSASMIDIEVFNKAEKIVEEQFLKNYTADEISITMSEILDKATNIHKTVTAAVLKANEENISSQSLGKKDENGLQIAYAVSGGKVINAGISEAEGLYIAVKSDNYIFTYGNLNEISAVPGERIMKGDIIGTFDSKGKKEFLYTKEPDNMV